MIKSQVGGWFMNAAILAAETVPQKNIETGKGWIARG